MLEDLAFRRGFENIEGLGAFRRWLRMLKAGWHSGAGLSGFVLDFVR